MLRRNQPESAALSEPVPIPTLTLPSPESLKATAAVPSPASRARVFEPSTFASRRADAFAFKATQPDRQRWLSLGRRSIMLDAVGRNGQRRVAEVEYLVDVDDHNRTYYRELGTAAVVPMVSIDGKEDRAERLPVLNPRLRVHRHGGQTDTTTPIDDL